MVPDWLWIVLTIVACALQTSRNAVHRQLLDHLEIWTALALRFIVSMPVAWLCLAMLLSVFSLPFPRLTLTFWSWILFAAVTQIFGAILMLAAMRDRGFLVSIALTKTEPLQAAMVSIPLLGETISPGVGFACVLALVGVWLLTFARQGLTIDSTMTKPAMMGLAVGSFFAIASIGMRQAILAIPDVSPFTGSATTVAAIMTVQGIGFLLWLLLVKRASLPAIVPHWRRILFVGIIGTLGSQLWFAAYALQSVTLVATVALVEVLMARVASVRVFAEKLTRSEAIGILLLMAGVVMVINR